MPAEKRVPAAAAGPAGKETLGWRPLLVVRPAVQCSFPGTHFDKDHTAFELVAEKAAAVNYPTLVAAADVEAVVAAFVAAELVFESVAVVACAVAAAVLTWSCQTA